MSELERIDVVPPQLPVATVRVTPDEAREMQNHVNQLISSVLVDGKDYMRIPGTPKPSLLKPGAEALQRFFGFGSTSQTETGTLESGEFFCKATVQVTNQQGLVLAEASGWCDNEEKGKKGPKWKGDRNTIIQMASKRAYVSAVKTATATSDHFTQDLEASAPQAVSDPGPVSSADERLILVELVAQKGGMTIPEAEAWLANQPRRGEQRWVARQVLALLLREARGGDERPASPTASAVAGAPPSAEPELPPDPLTIDVEVEDDDVPWN